MTTRDLTERATAPRVDDRGSAEHCPECDGPLRAVDGETCCADCGLVVAEDRLDRGPDWRPIDGEGRSGRHTGLALTETLHDRGLSTEIGLDEVGSGRQRRQLERLRREQSRARFASKAERNLARALGEIARMTSALELPRSVRERASVIYRRAQREELIPGRSIEAIAAGAVHAACRCAGLPTTTAEVASVAQCDASKVELGYAVLNRELGLATRPTTPADHVPKLLSAVDAPDPVGHRALELARAAAEAGLATGRHPGGVAAACVYLAGHEHGQLYTQAGLAELAGVSDVTVRTHRDALRELRA